EEEARKKAEVEARLAEARRKGEEQREAEERKEAGSLAAVPPPPPPVVEASKPAPRPTPAPKPPVQAVKARTVEGEENRRKSEPVLVEEVSPVRKARPAAQDETPPAPAMADEAKVRHEELYEEPNKVTMVIRLETATAVN